MALFSGHAAPDFTARTTLGRLCFHDWLDGAWGVLVTHPQDFRPGSIPSLDRSVKVIALPPVTGHDDVHPITPGLPATWATVCDARDAAGIRDLYSGAQFDDFPAGDQTAGRVDEHVAFVIAPDATIRATLSFPPGGDRDFGDVVRMLDLFGAGHAAHPAHMAAA
ncbi:hypothetical protein K6L44_13505 [Gluconacetobacter entanii]|uniref:Peroxiredoxin n=1 Tax=Gluconacetobacter entanii TaxID=108528 RepID=A0ABT3K633_9PROT|nr:hypothetical protein [Gluconacetobacter entanii]MCE2578656.1 hypothetical protein [Komagataeibacter sp. FNDCR1]MBY4640979.1 hypothetical protein [Gluconacetobacter entanii]MCW4579059.1 hypothetical protein [Gluconacetobacter entanii]MCW4582466.1 hypothetical protein [Gluconacetobacter entanii]MCW4585843.1 hypothetical protein [Gluconacetobacter entanii]